MEEGEGLQFGQLLREVEREEGVEPSSTTGPDQGETKGKRANQGKEPQGLLRVRSAL